MANGDNDPQPASQAVMDAAAQAASKAKDSDIRVERAAPATSDSSLAAAQSAWAAEHKAKMENQTPDAYKPLEFSIPKVSQEELAKSINVDQAGLNAQRGQYKGRNAAGNPVFTDPTGHDYVLYAGTTPFADGRYYPEKGAIDEYQYKSSNYMPDVERQLAGQPNPYTGKPYDLASMTDTEKLDALAQVKWHANLPAAPDGVKQDLNQLQTTISGIDGVNKILARNPQVDFSNEGQLNVAGRSAGGYLNPKDVDFYKLQEGTKSIQAAQEFLKAKADAGDSSAKALLTGLGATVGAILGKGKMAGDVAGAAIGDTLGSIAPKDYNNLRIIAPMYANALKSYYVNQAQTFLQQYQPGNVKLLDQGNRYVSDLNTSGIAAHGNPVSDSQMIKGPTTDAQGNPVAPVPEPTGVATVGSWLPAIGDWFKKTYAPQSQQGQSQPTQPPTPAQTYTPYQHGGLVRQPMPAPVGVKPVSSATMGRQPIPASSASSTASAPGMPRPAPIGPRASGQSGEPVVSTAEHYAMIPSGTRFEHNGRVYHKISERESVPHLSAQNHVSELTPGTKFSWRGPNGPTVYVKI